MKKTIVLLLVAAMACQANAQSTFYQTSVDKDFDDAFELFHKQQYAASKFSFEYLKEKPLDDAQKVDVDFYHAASALHLDNPDGPDLLNQFLADYSKELKSNDAAHLLGDYYFGKRDYRNAIDNFRKVNTTKTSATQSADVLFKTGYSFFQLKDYSNASGYFEQVKRSGSEYVPDAYYYSRSEEHTSELQSR